MALIDATSRFQARRDAHAEATRLSKIEQFRSRGNGPKKAGTFGEQPRDLRDSAHLTVDTEDDVLTLEEVFEQMNELGELDDAVAETEAVLARETVDTYTGSPEEQHHNLTMGQYTDLLRRAGLDYDAIPEKTRAEIWNGLERKEAERVSREQWLARQPVEPEYRMPMAKTAADVENQKAVRDILEARGATVAEYGKEGTEYLLDWANQLRAEGNFAEAIAEEIARSREEHEDSIRWDRERQDARLGPLTEAVWDEALEEDRLRALQQIRALRPTKYIPLKETNALIRGDLKAAFPSAKFSVRGNSYAGGASTDISYVDGPPLSEAEPVAKAYASATFDGMTDMKNYVQKSGFDADGIPQSISYGPDYVFVRREFSDETKQDAVARAVKAFKDAGVDFDPNVQLVDEIPQALMASDKIRSLSWRGYAVGGYEIVNALSEEIADEKWAARTAK